MNSETRTEKNVSIDQRTISRSRAVAVYAVRLAVLALLMVTCSLFAFSQRVEHYNSPLYSPKYYDPSQSEANSGLPTALKSVGIEQKLGNQLPLDTVLKSEDGNDVKLGSFFNNGRPVVLVFAYYECPMLCTQVLNGLVGSLKGVNLNAGKDFDVVAISFDPRDNERPDLAKNKKANYLDRYNRPGTENGWHFLTGSEDSIKAVTDAAGFKYQWDDKTQQFAHAAGVMIVTPEGKMSRYFYGIDYSPKDIKFGIMDSAQDKVGTPAEQLLLYCYHYDPATGTYGFAILRVIRLAGIATLLGMGAMAFIFWKRNKKKGFENGQSTEDA